MAFQNAYSAYQKTNVNTASQGKLVVLLYEGAIKQLTMALNFIDENDKIKPQNIEKFGICLQKVQSIITELQVSLDMEKGGDIATNLMALYVFFNEELVQASITKDKEKIKSVLKMMSDLAESWKIIANSTANAPAAQVENALNNLVSAIEQGIISNITNKRLKELEERQLELERLILIEQSKTSVKAPEKSIREFYVSGLELEPLMLINYFIKEIIVFDNEIRIQFHNPLKISPDENQGFFFYNNFLIICFI